MSESDLKEQLALALRYIDELEAKITELTKISVPETKYKVFSLSDLKSETIDKPSESDKEQKLKDAADLVLKYSQKVGFG